MCAGTAEEEGINGPFAIPVAFHPYSQKIFHRQQFAPTGVLVHAVAIEGYQELLDYVREHAEGYRGTGPLRTIKLQATKKGADPGRFGSAPFVCFSF